MEKIEAVVLAGGLGTRLRSELPETPKVLAPVNGKPFLDIVLKSLCASRLFQKVILSVGYKAEMVIENYRGDSSFGFDIDFAVEEKPLGTGGGIKNAIGMIESRLVMVLNGDSFVGVDLARFVEAHIEKGVLFSMVLREVKNANRYGLVSIDAGGAIERFEEKKEVDEKGMINAGIYLFDKKLFDGVEENRVVSFERDMLPDIIKKPAFGFVTNGKFLDIGIPETYKLAERYLKGL